MSNSNDDNSSIGRRRFITLAGVGGVGGITLALPGEWVAPIFDLVVIPAHAQDTSSTAFLTDIFKKSAGTVDDGNEANDEDDISLTGSGTDSNTTTGTSTATSTSSTTTPTSTSSTTTPTSTSSTTTVD